MKSKQKKCPSCGSGHIKPGEFCNRSCANSRGPRSEEFKRTVSAKLKGRRVGHAANKYQIIGDYCRIRRSPITGEWLSPTKEPLFWDRPGKARFAEKLTRWFDIQLGVPGETARRLDEIAEHVRILYKERGLSTLEIKDALDIPLPDGHMPAFVKQLGISRRSLSASLSNAYYRNRINAPVGSQFYKSGWHIAWDGSRQFYRSSYELALFNKLDSKEKIYKSEALRIRYYDTNQRKMRTAIPDLLIDRMLIEVKSDYTFDYQNMCDRFKAYREAGFRPVLVLEGRVWWFYPDSNRNTDI